MATKPGLTAEAYLRNARQEISAWEGGKRGYLARFGDFVLDPAAKLTARMVPKSVQTAAGQVIEKTLRLTAQAGEFSVDVKAITKERDRLLGRRRALGPRLKACDALAKKFWTLHCGYAAAEGAATGAIGAAGVVADLPLILSIVIRAIRTIGLCYGYDPTGAEETDYALHVLRIGSSSEVDVKAESLVALKKLEVEMNEVAKKKRTESGPREKASTVKYLMTIQEYAKSLAIEMVQRRALQLVPIAGAVTGASFNAAFANDIGRAAYMCYRRRFLHAAETLLKKEHQGYIIRP